MQKWDVIPDDKVRHVWYCEECEDEVNIEPDWYQNNGTPMCADCDDDMIYSHTEINNA